MRKLNRNQKEEGRRKKEESLDDRGSHSINLYFHLPSSIFHLLLSILTILCFISPAYAADKSWNAQGDQVDWFDDSNWLPAGAPSASDSAKIDMLDASVDLSKNYEIQSLTLGGKRASHLSVSNFTSGNITPGDVTKDAVINRKDGLLTLKGSAGRMTLRGTYKDTEEVIPDEPSFMFYVS
jgi:hypothetical protein